MAVLNRFYQPARGQYQSQFVPHTLPVDLMAKALYGKQALADQRAAEAIKLAEFDQRALGWHDTEYVKGFKKELEDFSQKAMTMDRTSPEFQREYLGLVNKIKKDEGLKSVSASVAKHDKYLARREELIKKGDNAWSPEMEADYLYRLGEYTKEGGTGFKAGLQLGDENILEGRKQQEDAIKFFTPMQESGADTLAFLGSGIAYKKGWTGISDKRVRENADRTFKAWMQTDAGKQDMQREMQKRGYVDTTFNELSAEEQDKLMNGDPNVKGSKGIMDDVAANFLAIGRTIVHGKSTTNVDTAYNTQRGEDLEKLKELQVVIPTNEQVTTEEVSAQTRDTKINELYEQAKVAYTALAADKKRIANGLPSNYTAEGLAQLKAQAASITRQKQQLELEKDQDYNNILNAQLGKNAKVLGTYLQEQNKILQGLKGKLDPEDFKEIQNSMVKKMGLSKSDEYVYNTDLIRDIASTLPDGETKNALNKLITFEDRKGQLLQGARERTNNIWEQEYTRTSSKVSIEPTGVTIRTDKNSTAAGIDRDIATNPESWNLTTTKGTALNLGKHTTILETKTNSATDLGDKYNTRVHLRRPVINADGEVTLNSDRTIKYEEVWVNANAVPVNEDTRRWVNNKIAQEQFEVARIKKSQGHTDEAELAYKHAVNLNRQSVITELTNFKKSNAAVTMIQTVVPTARGAATTEVEVKKVNVDGGEGKGGGYRLKYGNIEQDFNNIDEVNAYLQALTNGQ